MKQALINAFNNDILNCLVETKDTLIEIFDCYDCDPVQQKSYIRTQSTEPVHFTLNNPLANDLIFAAIDNCILLSNDPSRCDFAIGNFQKLYFVEVKQVKKSQRAAARNTAIGQLHASISLFRTKIDLLNTKLIAVICLKAKQAHPLQNAKKIADAVAFKTNYNADLMEGQEHTF